MQPATTTAQNLTEQPALLTPGQASLLRITQAISTAVGLDELLLLVLGELTQFFNVAHGSVILLDDDGVNGQIACEYPPRVSPSAPFAPATDPLLSELISQHQPLAITDVADESFNEQLRQTLKARGISSALVLPLVTQDRLIGAVTLDAPVTRASFSTDELLLGQIMASQLALAISSAKIYEAAKRRSAELDALNDIAATVTSSLDRSRVYALVVQKLNEYFHVEAGSILLQDDETGELLFVMTIEAGEEKLFGVRVPYGQGIVGRVAVSQKPIIVHDALNDPTVFKKVGEDVGFVTKSILCVPMLIKGKTIGVLELLNKLNGDFTEEDAARLAAMANTIAVAIENSRLFQEVARGRDRLEALLNSTEDGILMIDTTGVVVTANPMLERFFGLPWRDLPGQQGASVIDTIEQSSRPIVTPRAGDPDHNNQADVKDYEVLEPRYFFIREVKLPVQSKEGTLLGQLVIFHDLTEERQLEQLREDYTHMLVHDLRSPLTAILNGQAMLRRGLAGPINEGQSQLLDIAYNSGQSMLGMVNTLLDISKMEAGEMTLERQPCSLYELADSALNQVTTLARSSNIQLNNELPLGLPLVEIDREKILRVIQNLLDNAIKFTPDSGTIRIAASVDKPGFENSVVISVTDTGPGIPEEYRQRIFEKFGQIKDRKVKGTGLGLTFCKLAIEAHSGKIWVESEEAKGSTFAFTLPLQ